LGPTEDDLHSWDIVVSRVEGAVSNMSRASRQANKGPAGKGQGERPKKIKGLGPVDERIELLRIDSDGKAFPNKRIAGELGRTVRAVERLKAQTYRKIVKALEQQDYAIPIPIDGSLLELVPAGSELLPAAAQLEIGKGR
jgi:hypothetical protein